DGRRHRHIHNVHWARDHGCVSSPDGARYAFEGASTADAQGTCLPAALLCVWPTGFSWDFPDSPVPVPPAGPFQPLDDLADCVIFADRNGLSSEWCPVAFPAEAEDAAPPLAPRAFGQ
ncbi:MAG TPA: hypothetical protein VNX21_05040, partial [Candidatus Thermoplasmatota archaeon]|nr:hypothetical protein [Candidatus Thermoplasmatota archaeon]